MATYSFSGSIVKITVGNPGVLQPGTYDIIGYGGGGGTGAVGQASVANQNPGGKGAEQGGYFALSAGEKLQIIAGGVGGSGNAAGGGGFSEVLANVGPGGTYVPLLVAGGGGGGSTVPPSTNGTGQPGQDGTVGTAGSGNGGAAGAGTFSTGAGGAGANSNGTNGSLGQYGGGPAKGGSDAANGAAGGAGYGQGNGGFGGGGGAANSGGGGGGFTGGAGGSTLGGPFGGGGGTSFLSTAYGGSADATHTVGGQNAGNGKVVFNAVCFASGTLIRTTRGDVAVESLRIGDCAVTSAGQARAIKWLGHRETDCRRYPDPKMAWPVRIAANAFGENRPARDLYVSPAHSVCIDVLGEVLIPAIALVNGATVQQVEMDTVTYWHVELDSHDIVLAENLACESYLDMGNRGFFQESDVVDLAAGPDADPSTSTHADLCRPFHANGPVVDAVRAQMRVRALTLGWRREAANNFHLEVDGRTIAPVVRGQTARFAVPAGAQDVWLVSSTARPCDLGDSRDDRDLGIFVSGLAIVDGFGADRAISLDDPGLEGFHEVEDGVRRWTSRRAKLPAAFWADRAEDTFLRIELMSYGFARWAAPQVDMAAATLPEIAA